MANVNYSDAVGIFSVDCIFRKGKEDVGQRFDLETSFSFDFFFFLKVLLFFCFLVVDAALYIEFIQLML